MAPPLTIAVKRIYEPAGPEGGARFLVDRLWPRGVSKEKAALTAWLKPLSPSDALRQRFHGETAVSEEAWDAFRLDYFAELDAGNEEAKRSEEHTSELQSLMRISYAVFCLKKKHKKS